MPFRAKPKPVTFSVQYIGSNKVQDWVDYSYAKLETVEKQFKAYFQKNSGICWHKDLMERTEKIVIVKDGKFIKELSIKELKGQSDE